MPDLFNNAGSKISAIYELVKTYNNAELLLEISNLKMDLADIKSNYANLQNENTALKTKIVELEKRLENRGGSVISVPIIRG